MKNLILILALLPISVLYGQEASNNNSNSIPDYSLDKYENNLEYIRAESIGGEIDFEKMLVGYGSKDAKYKTHLYAISMWTQVVNDLGINKKKEIVKLWEEIYKKKMTTDEKNAVSQGLSQN